MKDIPARLRSGVKPQLDQAGPPNQSDDTPER